ncbi:cystatin-8 [Ochotona princeps]|uniref:cystatin-8 n=1 Tax=Ochotona princeps TaxID=9978 RepID=UPI00032B0BF9|nr:cystatin-8 [Ochotona princeps]
MIRPGQLSLLLLALSLALVASAEHTGNEVKVLRMLKPVNTTNANVRQSVWFAMQEYNRESEDKHIFLVAKILQAQLQITNRLEYDIDVEIARSNCQKPISEDESCVIAGDPNLEKKLVCNFWVGALPWNGEFTLLKKHCRDE